MTIEAPEVGGVRTVEVSARWVFDSVGVVSSPAPRAPEAHLDFLGLHVECATDTFDPGAVTLMDFRTDQSDGVSFIYVLPTSTRSALVERTTFVVAGAEGASAIGPGHEPHVRDYLEARLGVGTYRITGREVGTIPLERRPPAKPVGALIPIGARAGMVKASTGYGFERIQRHSAAMAACLTQGRHPARAAPAHRWYRALDDALLRVIEMSRAARWRSLRSCFPATPPSGSLPSSTRTRRGAPSSGSSQRCRWRPLRAHNFVPSFAVTRLGDAFTYATVG